MSTDNPTVTLTAVIAGFPSNLKRPQTLAGETRLQMVVRNNPREWENFGERMQRMYGLPSAQRAKFLSGQEAQINDHQRRRWVAEIQEFMNQHTPNHSRTMSSLAELRDWRPEPPLSDIFNFRIVEILFPGQRNPDPKGDDLLEEVTGRYGVKIVWRETSDPATAPWRPDLLAQVHGEFIWIVPGGTYVDPPFAALGLGNLLRHFKQRPRMAFFWDKRYTSLLRTAAIKEALAGQGAKIPQAPGLISLLRARDYEYSEQEMPLVALESIYGGERGPGDVIVDAVRGSARRNNRTWWQRLLRLE